MKYPKTILSLCLLASLVLSGCAQGARGPVGAVKSDSDFKSILAAQSKLKQFKNAKEIKDYFANHPTSGAISNQMTDMAKDSAPTMGLPAGAAAGLGSGPAARSATSPSADASGNYSGTNVQVQGVDESDIIKTDGNYIYAVSNQNLLIFKASDKPALISTTKLTDQPQEIYVSGDKLITFGYENFALNNKMAADLMPRSSATFLAIYDIVDRLHPNLARQLSFEGNYLSSRLIGNKFYFITANYQYRILADSILPRVYENGKVISGDASTDRYAFPQVYYIDTPSMLDATTVTYLNLDALQAPLSSQVFMMPTGQTVYASTNALYLAYTKYLSEYQLRMTTARDILANRLNDKERRLIQAISQIDSTILSEDEKLGKVNQIIEDYMARLTPDKQKKVGDEVEAEFNRRYPNIGRDLEKTVVHKIAFSDDGLKYSGSGEVSGHLLNQYSLDEYQGNLRLATTRSRSWMMPWIYSSRPEIMPQPSVEAYNNVYVLDANLKTIGALEDLAPKEQIYSARFVNERGYLVTFKQTDPLFVIDLANATKPMVVGEVKLPGFSNYLHPYDATKLIGIGHDAIDKGDQGVEQLGLKISLFDVADKPKEITSLVLGGRGSDSTALYDYKAVLFDRAHNLLAIPATLTKKDTNDYAVEFQGIIVFNVTDKGITERGRIDFRLPQNMAEKNIYLDDTARRSLFIGTNLYSFSPATLKANRLDNLVSIASINLPLPVQPEGKPLPLMMTKPATR